MFCDRTLGWGNSIMSSSVMGAHAETPSPIEVSSNTMEEVTVSDVKYIEENYGSNLKESPRSLVEDDADQVTTRNENT
ncbi:hypothetical protein E3N88_15642 [Mikania micrantha]|uniref:Uncharacterized protein n=1 Tax=Mikania micrantha TaxID=192012 RepID=A0A5N6NWK2_9ASTR|nr:hypothetical protein E3N88_15642 [Mikania micrantha]